MEKAGWWVEGWRDGGMDEGVGGVEKKREPFAVWRCPDAQGLMRSRCRATGPNRQRGRLGDAAVSTFGSRSAAMALCNRVM